MSPIRHLFRSRSRISERIVGEPLEIGGRTIRPVVRVSGWRSTGGDMLAGGTGVKLRTRPAGVIVTDESIAYPHPTTPVSYCGVWPASL